MVDIPAHLTLKETKESEEACNRCIFSIDTGDCPRHGDDNLLCVVLFQKQYSYMRTIGSYYFIKSLTYTLKNL